MSPAFSPRSFSRWNSFSFPFLSPASHPALLASSVFASYLGSTRDQFLFLSLFLFQVYGKRHLNRFAMPYGPAGGIRGALSFLNWSKQMVKQCQNICPSSTKSTMLFLCLSLSIQPRLNTHAHTPGAHVPGSATPTPARARAAVVVR